MNQTVPSVSKAQLFWGGLLPVVIFTVIEDKYGPTAGTIAALVFGAGEISYEIIKTKTVSKITLGSNFLIFALGAVSIITAEGIWFKLQPSILELIFAGILFVSCFFKKTLFESLMEKQQPQVIPILKPFLKGLSFRTGLFFLIHAVWAAWAAFYASTRFWAFLKGLGLPLTFVIYFVIEFLIMRKKIMIQKQKLEDAELASASPSSLLNEDIKN